MNQGTDTISFRLPKIAKLQVFVWVFALSSNLAENPAIGPTLFSFCSHKPYTKKIYFSLLPPNPE